MTVDVKVPPLEQAADNIRDLCRPSTTTENVAQPEQLPSGKWRQVKRQHVVQHASLLDQLRSAVSQSTEEGAWGGGDAKSKPTASVDAIDTLARITDEVSAWSMRLHVRRRASLEDRMSGLLGAVAGADEYAQKALAHASRSWLIAARIITGWERRPFEPDVPCPNDTCERRGTLRIRLDQRVGTCIECGTFWDTSDINRLGTYVQWAIEHLKGPRHWLVDEVGELMECMECDKVRKEMAARRVERLAVARASAVRERAESPKLAS